MDSTILTPERLLEACDDESFEAGLRYEALLEPVAGPGAPVKPAIYAGGVYQHDRRWVGDGDQRRVVDAIVVDNVASQANRLEAALGRHHHQFGLPRIVLDLSDVSLPVHLPSSITSFDFPHRNADAYLRDAELEGVPFFRHPDGEELAKSTPWQPEALYEWMPQALLFGFWHSHLGKKRQQTKLARSWVSEIIGLEPASAEPVPVRGVKGDPYNLSIGAAIVHDEDDEFKWDLAGERTKGKKDGLSGIGHGQVPFDEGTPSAVAFREVRQVATVSFAGLRRIGGVNPDAAAAGRALLVALGLAAHTLAFGRSFSLRSGADLRPVDAGWTWLGESADTPIEPLDKSAAEDLLRGCVEIAASRGLPVGPGHWTEVVLTPSTTLRGVFEQSYPDLDDPARSE